MKNRSLVVLAFLAVLVMAPSVQAEKQQIKLSSPTGPFYIEVSDAVVEHFGDCEATISPNWLTLTFRHAKKRDQKGGITATFLEEKDGKWEAIKTVRPSDWQSGTALTLDFKVAGEYHGILLQWVEKP